MKQTLHLYINTFILLCKFIPYLYSVKIIFRVLKNFILRDGTKFYD